MLTVLMSAFSVLDGVFLKGAYSSLELSKDIEDNRKAVTKIVYGVLDNNVKYDFFISQLAPKKPKSKIIIILKIGLYCLYNMDSYPDYAVIDNTVEMTKKLGKKETAGFVNALLKKAVNYNYKYPEKKNEYLSIKYSKPLFLVNYYLNRYGADETERILSVTPYEFEHIRYNSLKISREDFIQFLKQKGIDYTESKAGGFFVRLNDEILKMYNDGLITFQSMTSMLTVKAFGEIGDECVLDLCAAPGGKSVYIAEINREALVTSCDLHPHRVELIRKYAKRMGINNINTVCTDAEVYNPDYQEKYKYVLCDAPCSGFGLINKKPDIMLNSDESSIENLVNIQYNILVNAGKYCKRGGVIIYSTCTTIYSENEGVVKKFLDNNEGYILDNDFINYLPDNSGQDGFFIAKIRKL